jgi:drug/metabolite transporter (DMT)-like permease
VPPTEASMILSLEMVFGAVSGALFLGETMTGRELAGAALLLAGILLAQVPGRVLWVRRNPRYY